ncbi:NAD/FAD-dependent oxidoreductase [Spiribacter salinus M19-40]|uniref:NAD/FAD-dependent oxidoreductase n=1 Tax=Spiribacter salinus M19-40 TaxID=1260251 RepID=R4V4Y9_9GAMM|nr:NAD(P)-binding protein [Spiribacter salinus]AGM41014.1 NAD/FAD-dependent oxidoreductase [Spiribacter salinus M19-40]
MSLSSNGPHNRDGLSVAIIGSGIAGASAARGLALSMPEALSRVTLYEIGRGPGGRASTRKTRAIPELRINHGAPYADISTPEGLAVLSSLGDAVAPYLGDRVLIDGKTGELRPREAGNGEALITGGNGEMAEFADRLLRDRDNTVLSPIVSAYSTMVRGLARGEDEGAPWVLTDKSQDEVGRADWLVVAGSGVAHPRWSDTFGGEAPLVQATSALEDPRLDAALECIGQQTAAPVLTVLFYCTGEAAAHWQRLGFNDGLIEGHSVLAKVSIQPCGDSGCAIVLHSTTAYARDNAGVHGSSSSAARVGDAASDTTREDGLIEEMLAALAEIPGLPAIERSQCAFGPLLHRWGNAFPEGEPLPAALSVCPDARVAFCGDYISTAARMGSCESALLSGVHVADALSRLS